MALLASRQQVSDCKSLIQLRSQSAKKGPPMTGESCYEKPTMDSASWQIMDRVVVCRGKGAGELSSSQGRKVNEKSNGKYCIVH